MNTVQKEALKKVYKALGEFILLLAEDEQPDEQPQADSLSAKTPKNENPVTEEETAEPEKVSDTEKGVNGYSRKELLDLGFNGMKKLAKELGLTPKGDREAIINLLLNEKGQDLSVNNTTSKNAISPRGKKVEVNPKEEEEQEESDNDTENDSDDNLEAMVIEAVKDMSDEELADYLISEGIKNVKGKRQAMIALAVKEIRAGNLELSDEDDEDNTEKEQAEEIESESDNDADDEDNTGDTDDNDNEEIDLDEINNLNNPEMTEERAAAIEAYTADLTDQFNNGDFTGEDMLSYIKDYYGDGVSVADKDILKTYINIACLFINDDGDMPEEDDEPDAYYVNGVVFCCGHPCKWDEDNSAYICEVCGHEYPVE